MLPLARVRCGARWPAASSSCKELVRELKSAPIAVDGSEVGEAVDKHWESAHGHGVASLRYGAMRRPSPSAGLPPSELEDSRQARAIRRLKLLEERERHDLVDV